MKTLLAFLTAGVLIAGLLPSAAEAARVGSGRNSGTQRAAPPSAQKATPAPQQSQQAQSQAQPSAAAPQQAGNRWLGPVAGLAAGLGLGWLLSQGGFGGAIAAVLMALVAGLVIFALLRLFMKPRANPGGQPLQYSGAANSGQVMREPVMREHTPLAPLSSGTPSAAAPLASDTPVQPDVQLPRGFDAVGFLRQAKLNFIRLQQANDQGDLDTLREVTTDEMYQSIVSERGSLATPQATDVVNLEASLLEVSTEGEMHWASVRFGGNIREDGRDAAPFQEIWHLQKPVSGNSGWLLAGIQQVS